MRKSNARTKGRPMTSLVLIGFVTLCLVVAMGTRAANEPATQAHPASATAVCDCPFPGDANNDGIIDINDWVEALDVAFNRSAPVQDPLCPVWRTDFNGDGVVDAVDAYLYPLSAFDLEPCDPCGPVGCFGVTPSPGGPGNSVIVESKKLLAGSAGNTVAIRLTNNAHVTGIVIPLQLRAITPGAFPTDLKVSIRERIGAGTIYRFAHQYAVPDGACGGAGTGFSTITVFNDTSSSHLITGPNWGVLVACGWFFGSMGTGADVSGSVLLTMGVTGAPGTFEIDTACTDPANHLLFVNGQYRSTLPSFTKGTEEIVSCLCLWQGDIDANGVMDVFDVIQLIQIAFVGADPFPDPGCPTTRADYNNDGVVDVFDVIAIIKGVFSNGPPPADPCA
ncbi:MAG: hypothetical protein HZB43_13510 [candidate division Zixibacteria bacterium]|nr:hypothetical protein [candidate division Zixibacteria bacterium]